ncbi:hypothetical protein ACFLZ5_11145 [Thermodesulfobacteriota bacterium]
MRKKGDFIMPPQLVMPLELLFSEHLYSFHEHYCPSALTALFLTDFDENANFPWLYQYSLIEGKRLKAINIGLGDLRRQYQIHKDEIEKFMDSQSEFNPC